MAEIECIVNGKVQGVFFRDFVKKRAKAMWLTGRVANLSNGTVKVVAQGPKEKLERFIDVLHKGPFLARVRNVDVHWREESKEEYKDFKIAY